MIRSIFNWAIILSAAIGAVSPAIAKPPEGASEAQIAADRAAQALGERLYRHDRAAWLSSDALMTKIDPRKHPELRGYITEENDEGLVSVIYYAEYDDALYEFARFLIMSERSLGMSFHEEPRDHPLTAVHLRQIAAKNAAIKRAGAERLSRCSKNINTVILPPDEQDVIAVYLLSAPEDMEQYPAGGHYRFDVDASGKVAHFRRFMNSCLNVATSSAKSHQGKVPAAFVMNHLLDEQPTEIHYFVHQYVKIPMMISIDDKIWTVD